MQRQVVAAAFAAAFAAAAGPAATHTIWLSPAPGRDGAWQVLFGGHAGKLERYDPARLTAVTAVDAAGRPLPVRRLIAGDRLRLEVAGPPGIILADYDNGIHTRRSDGPSVARPMNEVPTALGAVRAQKHHKTIVTWTPLVTRSLGQPFEVVPLSAAQPRAGQAMRVRVLIDGRPARGVRVSANEEGPGVDTDSAGIATFTPVSGFNKLWAGRRTPVAGNPAYTEHSIEYSLGFDAR